MTYLSGLSTFVPELVSNEMFFRLFPFTRWTKGEDGTPARIPVTAEWFKSATDIRSRAFALREHEGKVVPTHSETQAIAQVALDTIAKAGLTARDIDAVVLVSVTLDGSTFHDSWREMWRLLGFKPECLPVHLSLGCSGLASGLSVSQALSHRYENVLLITSNFSSNVFLVDKGDMYTDNHLGVTYSLFGDAVAGVVVRQEAFSHTSAPIMRLSHLENTFAPEERLMFQGGPSRSFHMDGPRVKAIYFPQLLSNLQTLATKSNPTLADKHDLLPSDLGQMVRQNFAALLCHQVNPRILQEAANMLNLDRIQLPINADVYGNTSVTGTLVLLDSLLKERTDLHSGSKIAFSWVGAGLGMQRGNAILEIL